MDLAQGDLVHGVLSTTNEDRGGKKCGVVADGMSWISWHVLMRYHEMGVLYTFFFAAPIEIQGRYITSN